MLFSFRNSSSRSFTAVDYLLWFVFDKNEEMKENVNHKKTILGLYLKCIIGGKMILKLSGLQ